MDENKNNDISSSKQENKTVNNNNDITDNIDNEKEKEKEKLKLPKIQKEHIPFQLNKTNHKYEKDTFLTSKNIEKEKLRISNDFISNLNNENKLIFDLLKQKINISKNKNPSQEKVYKSNNNLIAYMNEAALYKNSHFRKREVKNLRKVKISSLITTPTNTYKKINKDKNNLSCNKKTIDTRFFQDIYNNDLRRLRTIEKKGIKHDTFDSIPSNWRKNRNCALKYKYNKNKDSIDVVASVLQDLGHKIKVSFDIFKNETENNFNDFMYDNEKIDF
jgi:hypothetical protein